MRRGELADYYLCPTGRLKEGKALAKSSVKQPLWPTAIRGYVPGPGSGRSGIQFPEYGRWRVVSTRGILI